MVAPISHGNSRAAPTPRANKSCHVAGSAPFLADMVLRSHSFNDATNMNTKRNTHGDQWSPCVFRRAGHEKQRGDMWLCQTHDAPASEKPVRHRPKMGYAVDPLMRTQAADGMMMMRTAPAIATVYPSSPERARGLYDSSAVFPWRVGRASIRHLPRTHIARTAYKTFDPPY